MLFRARYETDDNSEKKDFLDSRDFGWTKVRSHVILQFRGFEHQYLQLSPEEERDKDLMADLRSVNSDESAWYKVCLRNAYDFQS